MREVVASGKTVEEAVQQALVQLNATKGECEIVILEEGKKGFLGFGAKKSEVRVTKLPTPLEKLDRFVLNIIKDFGVDVTFTTEVVGKEVTYMFTGEEVGLLIGKRGATLNALQYVVQLAHHTIAPEFKTVILDAEGYRERRKETLIDLANKVVASVRRTKRSISLDPMPSFERKVIHSVVTECKDLSTKSLGVEPNRYITVEIQRKK
ncbi:MAG: RNA-binding cell elongation regulator Jag/EloR [Bacilli bacterium]